MLSSINTDQQIMCPKQASGVVTSPNFKSNNVATLERVPTQDSIEINKPKKKLSKGAKWAIGIGGTIATFITAGVLISKHQVSKLDRLFKEKLVIKNLPENLKFQEAKTLDDAMKFAKETLGVKEIDKNISLEALNWTNNALVNVSNANKGKAFIPHKIIYTEMEDAVLASANGHIDSKKFGTLTINKKRFSHEGLDKELKDILGLNGSKKTSKKVEADLKTKWDLVQCSFTDKTKDLANKLETDSSKMSLMEKLELSETLHSMVTYRRSILELSPLKFLKKNTELFTKNGLNVDIKALSKLSIKEQSNELEKLLQARYNKTGEILTFAEPKSSPFSTLYHELGHFQDYLVNRENVMKADAETLNFFKWMKNSKLGLEPLKDRWGGTTYTGYKDLLEKNPKKFKEHYPLLHEHLTNQKNQEIAGEVSKYATTSVSEFVAEVFAKHMDGQRFSDDVINLYKKYNGPLLPGM